MLHEFITENRERIIARTREKVAARQVPRPTEAELSHGVPLFLEQLTERLKGEAGPDAPAAAGDIGASASLHGAELLRSGITVRQVVHDYGNICQAVTELALEEGRPIATDDFRTLNLCLDIAIAEAVTEYARGREQALAGQSAEQLGFLAHELRNLLNTATLAYDAVLSGSVGLHGSTSAILGRSLAGMRDLVNRSLAEVRLEAGPARRDRVPVAHVLEEIVIATAMQAQARGVSLSVDTPPLDVTVDGDAQILDSIVTNLVQNACKFTHANGHVDITCRVTDDQVFIDVADGCGGLPPGDIEDLFRPYKQGGSDRTGMGLGLAISRRGAHAIGGEIRVRDVPGTGCVFTLELPRSTVE